MGDLSEREAVERCQRGTDDASRSAFRTLYEAHAPEVLRFLQRLLGEREAAEDATQETFLRLHRGLGGFDPARPLRPYVLQVARNVALDVLRTRKRRPRPSVLEAEPPSLVTEEDALRGERHAALEAALAALAPEHRALLALRFFQGLKLEEIALAQDCTARTIRNRLRAASVLLARELERRGLHPAGVVS